jgi:hypothetical protein
MRDKLVAASWPKTALIAKARLAIGGEILIVGP